MECFLLSLSIEPAGNLDVLDGFQSRPERGHDRSWWWVPYDRRSVGALVSATNVGWDAESTTKRIGDNASGVAVLSRRDRRLFRVVRHVREGERERRLERTRRYQCISLRRESRITNRERIGPGAGGWDSHVGGLVVEWLADVIVERRLLFLFPPFLPTADSGRTDPAVDPAVPGVVPLLLKWLEGTFEVESEGVNDKFLLSTTDCGTGIS